MTLRIMWTAICLVALAAAATVRVLAQTETIKVGYTGPITGAAAIYGGNIMRGLQLAVDQVNASNGIATDGGRRKFELLVYDDSGDPATAVLNAHRLAESDHAKVIFCFSTAAILAIQKFNEKGNPFILAGYSSQPVTLQQHNKLYIMIPPRADGYYGRYASIERMRSVKNVALLTSNTAYGRSWAEGFGSAWKAIGGSIGLDQPVDYNASDYSAIVMKALATKPDTMLVGGGRDGSSALLIRTARQNGYRGGFALVDQSRLEEITKIVPLTSLEGTIGPLPLTSQTGPGLRSFIEAYTRKFGAGEPRVESGLSYEAVHVLAGAIREAGSLDPYAVMARVSSAARSLPNQYKPVPLDRLADDGNLFSDPTVGLVQRGSIIAAPCLTCDTPTPIPTPKK